MKAINILIVDDEIYTTRTIKASIQWDKYGIKQVYTALNVAKSKEIIKENPIDLVICDIEMPKESGMDLLKWLREEGYNIEFIILTCHTNFDYARQAVRLGAMDYCVKPLIITDLENTIIKAVEVIRKKNRITSAVENTQYWEKNQQYVQEQYFVRLLRRSVNMDIQNLISSAADCGMMITLDDTFCIAVLSRKLIQPRLEQVEKETRPVLIEAARKHFSEHYEICAIIEEVRPILIVKSDDEDRFIANCKEFVNIMKKIYGISICCYYDLNIYCEEIPMSVEQAKKAEKEDVTETEGLYFAPSILKEKKEIKHSCVPLMIEQLLQSGQMNQFGNAMKAYLKNKMQNGELSGSYLRALQSDIVQSINVYLKNNDIPAHRIMLDTQLVQLQKGAVSSIESFLMWIQKLCDLFPTAGTRLSTTDAVKQYVHNHIGEALTREQLADIFYLNADYLAKVFKKNTGYTLVQYIIIEKIKEAELLLSTSETSIADISVAVGYDNFSYFSKLFRKMTGLTPREYRLQKRDKKKLIEPIHGEESQ